MKNNKAATHDPTVMSVTPPAYAGGVTDIKKLQWLVDKLILESSKQQMQDMFSGKSCEILDVVKSWKPYHKR